ncbi:hypothetical protein LV779_11880 [Streptomyces thinghirensis]|nr:hypothetical protein [Streptomyces thinghirensis]
MLRKAASRDDLDGVAGEGRPAPRSRTRGPPRCAAHSHPRWVVSALWDRPARRQSGVEELLAADNERLRGHPRRPPRPPATADKLRWAREAAVPGRWSPHAVAAERGAASPEAVDAMEEPGTGVKDEGSQLVALVLATAAPDGPDRRWLDGCAGPGSKRRAARAPGRRARCLHRSGSREAAAPGRSWWPRHWTGTVGRELGIAADGTRPAWRPGGFDRVLADVPCTALGALSPRASRRAGGAVPRIWTVRPAPARRAAAPWKRVRVAAVGYRDVRRFPPRRDRAIVANVLKQFPDRGTLRRPPPSPGRPRPRRGPRRTAVRLTSTARTPCTSL